MIRFLSVLVLVFVFFGCSSKNIYKPKVIAGKATFNGSVVTPIVDVARDGATLSDGRVITRKSGLVESGRLSKGFRYVSETDDAIVATNLFGDLYIISKQDFSVKNKLNFKTQILSATIKNNLLAMVDEKNDILVYDLGSAKLVYKEHLHDSVAVDSRLANPLFVNDLVFFPTLDGRLLIYNINQKRVLRDIAISDDNIFNNVIYLQEHNGTIIGATRKKVISITPSNIKNLRVGVKDVVYSGGQLYVFAKDGTILLLSDTLDKINELKLPNAVYSAVFAGNNYIYAVVKNGYLVEIAKDLSSYKVKELPDEVNSAVFGFNGKVYIGDKFITLE